MCDNIDFSKSPEAWIYPCSRSQNMTTIENFSGQYVCGYEQTDDEQITTGCKTSNFTLNGKIRSWDGTTINPNQQSNVVPVGKTQAPEAQSGGSIPTTLSSTTTRRQARSSSTAVDATGASNSLAGSTTSSSGSKSVPIGAGVGVPLAMLAFSLMGYFLIREKRRRKEAEEKNEKSVEDGSDQDFILEPKPFLDSSTIHEVSGNHGVAQELDSRPTGAVEIHSNQIHEAGLHL
ncbi:MAG: hypothetical protein Q9218_005068 [Villophora microphyllina]